MARLDLQKHIKFDGYATTLDYVYPKQTFGSGINLVQRNRNQHGNRILNQLKAIKQNFDIASEVELAENILRDDIIYTDFISEWGFQLDFSSLDQDKADPVFQIVNVREEKKEVGGDSQYRYHVTLILKSGGISSFIKKIESYISNNVIYKGVDTGNPRFYKLFTNIDTIQQATLKSFWVDEPEHPFPNEDQDVWWEAWFIKSGTDNLQMDRLLASLAATGIQIGQTELDLQNTV